MSVLLLVLVILAIFFQSIMQKQYNRSTNNQGTFIFNVVTFLSAAVVFFVTDTDGFMMDKALLPYILGFALCFVTAMLFIFLAIREGALSFTCLLKSYSLLVPTFYGVLFLDETVDVWRWGNFSHPGFCNLLQREIVFLTMARIGKWSGIYCIDEFELKYWLYGFWKKSCVMQLFFCSNLLD